MNFYGRLRTAATLPGRRAATSTCRSSLTQLLVPASQTEDIQMTARVLNGRPLASRRAINVAWAERRR